MLPFSERLPRSISFWPAPFAKRSAKPQPRRSLVDRLPREAAAGQRGGDLRRVDVSAHLDRADGHLGGVPVRRRDQLRGVRLRAARAGVPAERVPAAREVRRPALAGDREADARRLREVEGHARAVAEAVLRQRVDDLDGRHRRHLRRLVDVRVEEGGVVGPLRHASRPAGRAAGAARRRRCGSAGSPPRRRARTATRRPCRTRAASRRPPSSAGPRREPRPGRPETVAYSFTDSAVCSWALRTAIDEKL